MLKEKHIKSNRLTDGLLSPKESLQRKLIIVSIVGLSGTGKSEVAGELIKMNPKVLHLNRGEIFRLMDLIVVKRLVGRPQIERKLRRDELPDPTYMISVLEQLENDIQKGEYTFEMAEEGMHCFMRKDGKKIDIHRLLQSESIDSMGPPHNSSKTIQKRIDRIGQTIIDKSGASLVIIDSRTPHPNSNLIIVLTGSLRSRAIRKIISRKLDITNNNIDKYMQQLSDRDAQDKDHCYFPEQAAIINTDDLSGQQIAKKINKYLQAKEEK